MSRLAILGSRGIPANYGGFEVAAESIAKGLVQRGWSVTVFCPHDHAYRAPSYEGVTLRRAWHPPGAFGSLTYDALSLWAASRGDFDAILMFGYGAGPLFVIPRLFGVPIVVNTDGLEWQRSKWSRPVKLYFRLAERLVSRLATRLISDAPGIQRYYRDRYHVESECIAYGAELREQASTDMGALDLQAHQYYLVVMRLEPENSILDIVRGYLASRAARPLVIVGLPTPYFDRQVQPLLNGQNRVRLLGPIYDRGRLFALRQNAFVYVHGHSVGGTNPSLLEAMACGNFVVARDVEFNRDVLGAHGRYFTSANDLARTLNELEGADPSRLREAGEHCQRIIARSYRWDQIVEAYASAIRGVVRRSRGPTEEIP